MHSLKGTMHKSPLLRTEKQESFPIEIDDDDIQHQDRLAKVLTYHSKGISQI
jgi:hypothetical protein